MKHMLDFQSVAFEKQSNGLLCYLTTSIKPYLKRNFDMNALLNICSIPGTVLGAGDMEVNKQGPGFHWAYV